MPMHEDPDLRNPDWERDSERAIERFYHAQRVEHSRLVDIANEWAERVAMAEAARIETLEREEQERERDPRSDLERITEELADLHDWLGYGSLAGAVKLVDSAARRERKALRIDWIAVHWNDLCLSPR